MLTHSSLLVCFVDLHPSRRLLLLRLGSSPMVRRDRRPGGRCRSYREPGYLLPALAVGRDRKPGHAAALGEEGRVMHACGVVVVVCCVRPACVVCVTVSLALLLCITLNEAGLYCLRLLLTGSDFFVSHQAPSLSLT